MKTIEYFICLALLLSTTRIYSQIPDTVWTKTFGGVSSDVGNSVKQTNDGGFIVAATTSSFGAGGQDIWLIKTDENGDTLWSKTFGGTGNDRAANVVQTNDNGYAVFGTTNSYGNGGDDFLIYKTDSLGNTQWFHTYGGNVDERAYEGQQTADSGYVIVGDSIGQNIKAWIIKIDKDGNFTWERTIGTDIYGKHYHGYSVQQTVDGGYILSGSYAYLVYPPGFYVNDYLLFKVSSTGNYVWMRLYGDLTFLGVWNVKVKILPDGNFLLGGAIREWYGGAAEEPWILKTDQSGNVIWDNIILGSQYPAVLTSIEATNDNGFIFTIYGPNISLLKCDKNGILTWEKIVGGPQDDRANSIWVTSDDGYIVAGQTKSFGAGDYDIWLLKFKYNPPQINFFPAVDTAYIYGGCCTPEIIARNLSSTSSRDSISIEPGLNSVFYYIDSTGTQVNVDNFYFIVIDSLDEFDYELQYYPKASDTYDPIIIPFDSSCYIDYNNFDIQLVVKKNGEIIDSLSQPFHADFGLGIESSNKIPEEYSLYQNYPNPFNPVTSIQYAVGSRQFVSLKVYDVLGNEVATLVNEKKQSGTYEVKFDGTGLPSGIYFYQLLVSALQRKGGKSGNFVETKKMILLK